jgi:hypothetical protein
MGPSGRRDGERRRQMLTRVVQVETAPTCFEPVRRLRLGNLLRRAGAGDSLTVFHRASELPSSGNGAAGIVWPWLINTSAFRSGRMICSRVGACVGIFLSLLLEYSQI